MVSLNDLFTPANRAIVALVRSPLGGLAGRALTVLEYTGRVSGRHFTIPVGYQLHEGTYVVVVSMPADKTWWKNFREPWPATLTIGRKNQTVSGVVIGDDDPAFYGHIETTLRRLPFMGSQLGGVKLNRKTGLTDEQRTVLAEHAVVVQFIPDPESV